jgi:transcriptional regulator with XRE-family HTH domain
MEGYMNQDTDGLGLYLRDRMAATGMTGRQLAQAMGVRPSSVSRFLGKPPNWLPQPDTLRRLSDALGVPVSELVAQVVPDQPRSNSDSVERVLADLRADLARLEHLIERDRQAE